MCQLCGCSQYIAQGKEAILRRAVEIVSELGLTAELEQFSRELDDADLASTDPGIGRAIKAVSRVHNDLEAKEAGLKQRYGL